MRARVWLLILVVGCGPARATQGGGDDDQHPDAHGTRGDGGGSSDGSMPVMCGGTICRADQTCNAGVCEFACQGATVPGDYATIQSAIDALAATGNDSTICLGPNSYSESSSIYVRDSGTHGKALRIIGPSMDRTRIMSSLSFQSQGWHSLTVQGVELGPTSNAISATFSNNETLNVIGTRIRGQGMYIYNRGTVLVDGSVFDVTNNNYGIEAYASSTGPLMVTIENSYFKSAYVGAYAEISSGQQIQLSFVNNAVVGCRAAMHVGANVTATVANSIFASTSGIALEFLAGSTITNHHNALWGNTTNYAGIAADGAGYVKQDCMLDQTGLAPSLHDGSPCRNAGDAAAAPTHDFYGAARGGSVDIGAVQQ